MDADLDLPQDIFTASDIRELFKIDHFEVDAFLYRNYRFTPINVLKKELSMLHAALNDELIELINTNFNDFIRLGSSLNGSLEAVEAIKVDLASLNQKLAKLVSKLTKVNHQFQLLQRHDESLNLLKFKINLIVLINSLMRNFELLLKDLSTWIHAEKSSAVLDGFQTLINLTLNLKQLVKQVHHPLVNLKKFNSLLLELEQLVSQYKKTLRNSDSAEKSVHLFELYNFHRLLSDGS